MRRKASEIIREDLDYYFNENHDIPLEILIDLAFYNKLCAEDDSEDFIKIFPENTIFGVPAQIIENAPYHYRII